MKEKKFRIPRKKKKKIPMGMYCYTMTSGFKLLEDGKYGYTIKCCPYYKSGKEDSLYGSCNLLKCEVEDQCKSCGTKYGI